MINAEKKKWVEIIEVMKGIYPNDDLLIINPKTYDGYNLETGKRIRVVQEEYEDD
jgi:hypothetical protein